MGWNSGTRFGLPEAKHPGVGGPPWAVPTKAKNTLTPEGCATGQAGIKASTTFQKKPARRIGRLARNVIPICGAVSDRGRKTGELQSWRGGAVERR